MSQTFKQRARLALAGSAAAAILLAGGIPFAFAHAQEETSATGEAGTAVPTTSIKPTAKELRAKIEQELKIKKDAVNAARENLKTKVETERNTLKAKVETARDEAKQKIQTVKQEAKERLAQNAADRVKKHVEIVTRRLSAALDRLTKLADRLDSRMDKLEERGVELNRARTLLETARTEIRNARTAVAELPVAVAAVITSDNPKESFAKVRELVSQTEASVKKAHKALVDAIAAVKAAAGAKKIEVNDAPSGTGGTETPTSNQ